MSASRMIDDIIKSFLALPTLTLSPEISKEFHYITNRLITTGQRITLENFNTAWALIPQSCITLNEMNDIVKYLVAYESMMNVLDKFIPLVQAGWNTVYGKPISGDDVLPLLINLIPADAETVAKLQPALHYACDIDQMNYYLNAFATAAEYHHQNKNFQRDAHDEKCRVLIRDLRLESALTQLEIEATLHTACRQKMEECYTAIYLGLALHNIHDYDFPSENKDLPELIKTATPLIIQMYASNEERLFVSYPELGADIKKFIAYYEFLQSINRKSQNNIFERLRELSYKFPVHENALGDDLDTLKINTSTKMQIFLGIPDDKRTSVFNLLWAPPRPELTLRKFMEYLTRKITQVEAAYEEKQAAAANSSPPAVNL